MSDSNSQQSQQQTFTDNRSVLGEGAIQATSGATVYALDNGAIARAFDSTDKTVAGALQFGDSAFKFGGAAMTQVATAVNKVLDASADGTELVKDAYADAKGRGALTDKILLGTVAGALIVAAMAVKKG